MSESVLEAITADYCERRLKMLDKEQGRIAQLKLEGYKNREIAEMMSCSITKVERKLKLLRERWSEDENRNDKYGAGQKVI